VWDLKTGGLLHVFDAPITEWVDNAAFAISPDNRHLAFSGSTSTRGQAVVWNLATGANEGNWSFSPGLNNLLAFHATGKLLLFQVETKDGKHLPDSTVDRSVNPLVFRVRDLRSADPKKPLFEITEFNRKIDWPVISEDGNTLALVGYSGDDQPRSRRIKAFDGLTGK
jgi:WD40 repeat protein